MNVVRLFILVVSLMLAACQSTGSRDTIAKLRGQQIEIKEEEISGGLDKAMQAYQQFLEEAPESDLKPEAIRRLADLKIAKEYGILATISEPAGRAPAMTAPKHTVVTKVSPATVKSPDHKLSEVPTPPESDADFEKRAVLSSATITGAANSEDLERASAREAIALYEKLIKDYPSYDRSDQVLYQMSRAYEELGQVDPAMKVMDRLVKEYPKSRYMDEVQFRRAEYLYTRRHYLDAEDAYGSIVKMGTQSPFYQLALYKLGWTFYKQELYEEALDRYIALLDYKVSVGYDFYQTKDEQEKKRIDDTFRAISLCFSSLHGDISPAAYFESHGKRSYEDGVYSNLGEFYFDKQRYADAATVYNAFVGSNPHHKVAPQFAMRVIEIDTAGAFPSLVIDAKKQFAHNYGLQSEYWKHFEPSARPEVLAWLKTNLTDLSKHYHSLYQDPKESKEKKANYEEARNWYREFLTSFPKDTESPGMNYLLADLYLENQNLDLAAIEYERTAYEYPRHEKSKEAGYAAVYAYRKHMDGVPPEEKEKVKRLVVASSLRFADTYPEHEKAAIVLGAAADDLYNMKDYEQSVAAARKLIEKFPGAGTDVVRGALIVAGHGTYELHRYNEAEAAYSKALTLFPDGDKGREALTDNLAAAVYKQGEDANAKANYKAASEHFLRVGRLAPASTIRVNAEYDAAAALIQLKDWQAATAVLAGFRTLFPEHALLPEVTKKIAYVYREDGKFTLAAGEYERMEKESNDDEVRREALLTAAELHEKAGDQAKSLLVYRRYVDHFPHPVEANLETRNKIAESLKKNERENYLAELKQIVAIDAGAGAERTPRTRYLAGKGALVLAEEAFGQFTAIKLVQPFKVNLDRKKGLMKVVTQQFSKLLDYEVGEVTAAATFYLAEIYADFSKDLKESERPRDLTALELEEYELALEEQAYPFEEKAIFTHKSNLELVSRGVYNEWVDKSLQKLAVFLPARYNKPEEESLVMGSADHYLYAIERHEPAVQNAEVPKKDEKVDVPKKPEKAEEKGSDMEPADVQKEEKMAKPEQNVMPRNLVKKAGEIGVNISPSESASK
jgi:cellulose synthase operon protein C